MVEKELERKFYDFREMDFFKYTPRSNQVNTVNNMVSTIVGARRVGKSVRCNQIIDEAIKESKINHRNQVCYVDFDNPILARMKVEELKLIQIQFLKINPDFTLKTPIYFIFDEIHKIEGWEDFVIDLSRNNHWRVYVTGSSSKMLQGELSASLRGKSISTTMYPFDFEEFLRHQEVDTNNRSTVNLSKIYRYFEEYLKWGAFPAVGHLEHRLKGALLTEYFDTMILRDIIERYNVSKPQQCIFMLKYLLSNTSRPFTLESAYKAVKNAGHSTSKDSIRDYLEWAQDSHLCFKMDIFSHSLKDKARNYSKIYCIDWALANVNNWVWDGEHTKSLENLVYIQLKRQDYKVNYYLTRENRQEIDFLATNNQGEVCHLIQVSLTLREEKTRKRETSPLISAMKYFKLKKSYIITLNQEEHIKSDHGDIHIIPAWKWLLSNEGAS